jgi:plastocyanin
MALSETQKELTSIALALVALGGCVSVIAAETVTVGQKDRQFSTDSVTIAAGDTIRFTNDDPFIHQLYTQTAEFSFNSGEQPTGVPVNVAFPVAGTYQVLCQIHPRMRLTVNVQK